MMMKVGPTAHTFTQLITMMMKVWGTANTFTQRIIMMMKVGVHSPHIYPANNHDDEALAHSPHIYPANDHDDEGWVPQLTLLPS